MSQVWNDGDLEGKERARDFVAIDIYLYSHVAVDVEGSRV